MKTNHILVENKFGHGAIKRSKFHKFITRTLRPTLGRAGIPFDWNTGFDIEQKIGKVNIKNQGSSSSCGGQAGSYFLEIQQRLKQINEGAISAKSIYAPMAAPGGGMTVSALETQIGAHGANLEMEVHSTYVDGTPLSESMYVDQSWMTPETIQSAIKRAGYLPIQVPIDIESMAEAMRDYGSLIIEIQGQNNGTWLTQYPYKPVKTNSGPVWAHFMAARGAKMANGNKQLDFYQSWGDTVGLQGVQSFTEDYINSGYIVDCFTFIPDEKITVKADNHTIWGAVVDYFRRLRGLAVV